MTEAGKNSFVPYVLCLYVDEIIITVLPQSPSPSGSMVSAALTSTIFDSSFREEAIYLGSMAIRPHLPAV
jgi:hypothetical protein